VIRSEGNIAAENVENAEEAEITPTCSNTKHSSDKSASASRRKRKYNQSFVQYEFMFITENDEQRPVCVPGPALASAGPDWKHFCGAPLSGVCRNFRGGVSSHNDRNR